MSKKNKVLDKVLGLPYNRYIKGYFMLLQNKESNLTSGLEDYIETIYMSHLNDTPLKGAELQELRYQKRYPNWLRKV